MPMSNCLPMSNFLPMHSPLRSPVTCMIFLVLCTSILRPVSAATARHLRSVGPDLRDAPIARPAVFYMLLAIAVATILGSVLCLYRDVMRHKQYNQFQSRGEERDAAVMEALTPQKREPRRERVPSAESDTAAQVPSTIEDHIEGLIESVVQMRLPPQLQFARYLESLQSISPLYASVRCMSALCRPGRNLAILRERTAPLSITWLLMISRLVNFIVCVAVITYLFLANPGVCSMGGSSEAACRRPLRLDGHRQLCVWDEALEECGFDATTPGSSDDVGNDWLYYYLVLPVLSLLLASPLNLVCESVISLYIDSMRLHTADFKSSKFSLPLRLVECSASPVLRSTPPRGAEKGAQRQQVTAPRETLIRAVRLFNLQGHLDKVDLPDEKNSIMNSMSLSGHQRTRLLRLFCVPEKCDAAEYVNGVVENRVRRTRKDCRDICTEVMPLLGALAREQYLVRLFLQQLVSMGCSLSAHCESPLKAAVRGEAARCYLFGDLHSPVPSSQAPQVDTDTALLPHVAKACGYLFILISYLLGCCATLFVFGAHLGKAHSAAWVDRVVISYLIVFVVLDPLRAFVYEVSMHCIANRTLQPLAETLVQRTGYVLSRLSGQLDMDSCGVQSALVACRVARTFPSLPIARLLMSLRDADVVGVQKRTIDSQAWCNFLSGPVAAISLGRLLLVLRHHVGSTLVYFTLGAGFVLSLQFGSTIAAIAVAVIVCVQWGVSNFYFILCAYETIMLFVVSRMCCCLFSSAKYTIVKQSAGSHPPVVVRGLSSESLEGRDVVEFRNVDSMELGYFSDKQESIRSEQKNKNSPLLLPQNSFLRNPSLASFGSHPRAGASVSRSSSDRHERHRSMDSVSLHSENSAQSGPIMLIKHMRSNTFSSSEEEESSDDDDMSSRGRGIDHLLGGSVKRPASRSPRKKRSPPNTNGSPKKTTKKGHYSPALRRLSSLRRSSSHEGTPAGGEDATCEELMISGGVPDVSAVGDIQRNRWVRLKRTWAAGSSASRGNRGYPIPYTVLESINEEDIEVIDEKPYIYGHISPKSDSKRTARVLQGKVLSVTACSFDSNGSLWVLHEEDEAWFFAFDMRNSKRGAVLGHHIRPTLATVLFTELRAPHKFGSSTPTDEELPSYESVFTFQLLFTKGVAVELRRSFGALEDLNTTVVNSLKALAEKDVETDLDNRKPYEFQSPLPVVMEGSLELYRDNESKLAKFVAKVERWLVELLFFLESDRYEDTNVPVAIANFLAPNQIDIELMTDKILQSSVVRTPPPSPSYVKKRPSGKPMFEADLFEY